MQFFTNINIPALSPSITYRDKILLTGSCFTEHIGNYLAEVKFNTLQNPNGILFDPVSVCSSLLSYVDNKQYNEADLFYLNESWHNWQHHSRFSNPDKNECLRMINESQTAAHEFLKTADWLIITLGSAFSYRLVADSSLHTSSVAANGAVANCHKAPAQQFSKHLCSIDEIISLLDNMMHRLFLFNRKLKIIFTISPVRHLRDGVIDNNRSKARLIEAVHQLVNKFDKLHYFPAYELVIDVLRDYRFYDIDLAHPNYTATQFVLEKFSESCFDNATQPLTEEIKKIVTAAKHKPFNPQSQQHTNFLKSFYDKTKQLQQQHAYLDFSKEMDYFSFKI